MCELCDEKVRRELALVVSEIISKNINSRLANFEKELQGQMSVMSNSFLYISKLLENSGLSTGIVQKEKISWESDIKKVIYELTEINKREFPTYNSVLKAVISKMRNVYGIVIEQLKKDYKYKYGLERFPDALEAVGDDETARKVFESVLYELFPSGYWSCKAGVVDDEYIEKKATPEEQIQAELQLLAEFYDDHSKGNNKTLRIIYSRMDCSWSNLITRYKKKYNVKSEPTKMTIVMSNPTVFKKFKKAMGELLDEATAPC